AADFRIGSSDSWYSMPEVRIGIPSVLESVNLHRLMGWTKATEFVLTGNRFSAEDMLACGFLTTSSPRWPPRLRKELCPMAGEPRSTNARSPSRRKQRDNSLST
ncbi:MAG: enoyl-CoA hydratase/isomerase family protein, partial [Brevibacterium linens]|uniref:enoyl-CoA hydratase/isomerase family protein n=1 Tax=Brevibacterium linens TaxID=1703 RepID=UPI003F9460B8